MSHLKKMISDYFHPRIVCHKRRDHQGILKKKIKGVRIKRCNIIEIVNSTLMQMSELDFCTICDPTRKDITNTLSGDQLNEIYHHAISQSTNKSLAYESIDLKEPLCLECISNIMFCSNPEDMLLYKRELILPKIKGSTFSSHCMYKFLKGTSMYKSYFM
ncbi:TPA_asm: protein 3 [Arceuthobium virus 8]|uniref:Protein 3 n=1 Tax=Arceuthobium virus 8 TaxID=2977953 RepID=A0A9N6YJF1_9RHAB|nr:TPA_asm: protein 3 [Arceuthobium virus 8]